MGVNIKKSTVISIVDSENNEIKVDDVMIFETNGKVFIGAYKGIANRGALIFKGIREFSDVEFHVMPSAISSIYPFTKVL